MLNRKLKPGQKGTKKLVEKYGENQLGRLIKSAGGFWNKEGGYWELPYREAVSLGLDNRIMND